MKRIIAILAILLMIISLVGYATMASAESHGAKERMKLGGFEYSNGHAQGLFVSFNINPTTGEVKNYTLRNITVFSEINYQTQTMGRVLVHGSMLMYTGYGIHTEIGKHHGNHSNATMHFVWRMLIAHDNPTGVLHILARGNDTLTFTLAPNITIINTNTTNYCTEISLGGNITGKLLISQGNVSINGTRILIQTGEVKSSNIIFLVPAKWYIPGKIVSAVMQEIEKGKMGGQMYISDEGQDFVNYTSGLQMNVLEKERNRIQISVSAEGHEGKFIMLTIDKNILEYGKNRTVKVMLDSMEIKMEQYSQIFNESQNAAYAVINDTHAVTILIYVPHFSEHALDVQSVPVSGNSESSTPSSTGSAFSSETILIIGAIIIIVVIVSVAVAIKSR